MKLDELISLCQRQTFVLLQVPTKRVPKGKNIRLFGKGNPLGSICNVKEVIVNGKIVGYDTVAYFKSDEVLKRLGV